MMVDRCLWQATQRLKTAAIGTARLDALVLLEDVTGVDRARLLAEPELKLTAAEQTKLKKLLNKRVRHMPLAYVRGKTEFYGRTFVINPGVLEPRPESETMIDLLKKLPKLPVQPKIADVGSGSGALGITAALEVKNSQVELLEVESKALKVAQINVDKYTMKIRVIQSDLLTKSSQNNDVLLCNLPYVPDDYQINLAAGHEPKIAIFGGPDGLDLYRKLFKQVAKLPKQPLYILTEALPMQHKALKLTAKHAGYKSLQIDDFIIVFGRIQ